MNKRPKSREETPKEGSDSARRYRTATICDRDAQNASVFETISVQSRQGWRLCHRSVKFNFLTQFQYLKFSTSRGHAGENPGELALISLINDGHAERNAANVFGCPLFATAD